MFPNPLTGGLWKIATGGAALISLVLGFLLVTSYLDNKKLADQRDQLTVSINDPKVGYIAQLAQARTNVETLKIEVERQNQAITRLSDESAARLAAARRELAAAQAQTRVMETKLAGFLSTKPQGATLEDRVRDIDDRAMKEWLVP